MFTSVFSADELIQFYDQYFKQIAWESTYLEVQSINTGHFWLLIKDPAAEVPVKIMHKYRRNQPYHPQCYAISIASGFKKIKRHDTYVLKFKA